MTRTSHTPELAAPTVAPAQKTGINLAAAAHLVVEVSPYPDMDSGDLIELTSARQSAFGCRKASSPTARRAFTTG